MHSTVVLVAQSCLTLYDPRDCSLPGSPVLGILQARILEWVTISFSKGSSRPRDQTGISCVSGTAGGFFTIGTTGKPKNTGVVSLSILQGTFPTHKLNQGLLRCKQILYQLSYQGNPKIP